MRFDDYNRAENACRIGLALTVLAAILNLLSLYAVPGNTALDAVGVACAVLSLSAAYFAESLADSDFGDVTEAMLFQTCVIACVASYAAWFLSLLV